MFFCIMIFRGREVVVGDLRIWIFNHQVEALAIDPVFMKLGKFTVRFRGQRVPVLMIGKQTMYQKLGRNAQCEYNEQEAGC